MATQTGDLASDTTGNPDGPMTLSAAFQVYVQQMPEDAKQAAQPEIAKIVRWLGADREIASISASEIGEYSEQQTARSTSVEAQERLSTVKTFLTFLKKSGSVETNLAQHLRVRKSRAATSRTRATRVSQQQQIRLTKTGYDQMTKQLSSLQEQRQGLTLEIQKAAADGDVRENAPLEAARENQGMVMGKIRELEATLKMAVVIDGSRTDNRNVHIGTKVELTELNSGKTLNYQLVEPNESSPLAGKISIASPVGAAILGRAVGAEVAVVTPKGKHTYRIDKCS
ncbi:MAG: GreA/GreB family elongation factor [Chloroflexi bacterium]|nr:GreA/GreB family elongation factor [Chloroflexota bacterium]